MNGPIKMNKPIIFHNQKLPAPKEVSIPLLLSSSPNRLLILCIHTAQPMPAVKGTITIIRSQKFIVRFPSYRPAIRFN